MTKNETNKLTNKIKGYYNSQFFVDDYVLDAWYETMKPYDLVDAEEHLKEYLKDFPEQPPKPHTFIRGLYTPEEKDRIRNQKFTVECNLCHRWMSVYEYDEHYGKCLDINYLVNISKEKCSPITREELENCKPEIINKLLAKYEPKKIDLNNFKLGEIE